MGFILQNKKNMCFFEVDHPKAHESPKIPVLGVGFSKIPGDEKFVTKLHPLFRWR